MNEDYASGVGMGIAVIVGASWALLTQFGLPIIAVFFIMLIPAITMAAIIIYLMNGGE